MSKTITAHIPARKVAGKTYKARIDTFTQNDAGQWIYDGFKLRESEVIDICRRATNWAEIRSAHFQMDGFHS